MQKYSFYINSLTIYSAIKQDPLISKLDELVVNLTSSEPQFLSCVNLYSQVCNLLYKEQSEKSKAGNLYAYVLELVKNDDNFFSRLCVSGNSSQINQIVANAVKCDLTSLCKLSQLESSAVKEYMAQRFPQNREIIELLPDFTADKASFNWGSNTSYFEFHYKQNPTGPFSKAKVFTFNHDTSITPVKSPDPITFADIKHYDYQKEQVQKNTLAFLGGKSYNNVLLYGDRGTGKSSTVKALVNEYHSKGLRLIGVSKSDLVHLDKLIDMIIDSPFKFIIFIDDLTFNENDDNFGMLKAILEGSVVKCPTNMAIYATTNRRHLIKETFTAREGDEIHKADTIDENLSLSDRFGLILTYSHPNKDKYLDIVKQIATDRGIALDEQKLLRGAEEFATLRGGRSGRTAKQYIDSLSSQEQ